MDIESGLIQLTTYIIPVILLIIIVSSSIKIIKEYERAVIFRLGRLVGAKGPGPFVLIPGIDSLRVIDLRVVTFDVPNQQIITKDNVTVDVDAVVYYRVFDPIKAVVSVEDYISATNLLGQTALRDTLGQVELDDLLQKREELSKKLTDILDIATDPWGIKIGNVAIKDVSLPEPMQRAIAKQAEAEREKRARIIIADGEQQASAKMAEAAKMYESSAVAIRLRELQSLTEIAREKNLIVVTPFTVGSDVGATVAIAKGMATQSQKKS